MSVKAKKHLGQHFLTDENIANKIWYIEDHEIKEYPGTYQEYEVRVEERGLQSAVSDKAVVSSAPPQKASAQPAANTKNSTNKPTSNEDLQKLKKAKKRYEDLYQKNYNIQDYKEARSVQDSLNKLIGLNEPDKKEIRINDANKTYESWIDQIKPDAE